MIGCLRTGGYQLWFIMGVSSTTYKLTLGAGTTAAGLREGVPTVIVPFFGDQWFWGTAVHDAGAGPAPIPYAQLTSENLAEAIQTALLPFTKEAAQKLGERIRSEDGVKAGVESLYRHLPVQNMRCQVDPKRAAVWWCEKRFARLSGAAAAVLVEEGLLCWKELVPHREYALSAADIRVSKLRRNAALCRSTERHCAQRGQSRRTSTRRNRKALLLPRAGDAEPRPRCP